MLCMFQKKKLICKTHNKVSSVTELCNIVSQYNTIGHLILRGHGSNTAIQLGDDEKDGTVNSHNVDKLCVLLQERLTLAASVFIWACNCGNGLANQMSERLPGHCIYASPKAIPTDSLTMLNPIILREKVNISEYTHPSLVAMQYIGTEIAPINCYKTPHAANISPERLTYKMHAEDLLMMINPFSQTRNSNLAMVDNTEDFEYRNVSLYKALPGSLISLLLQLYYVCDYYDSDKVERNQKMHEENVTIESLSGRTVSHQTLSEVIPNTPKALQIVHDKVFYKYHDKTHVPTKNTEAERVTILKRLTTQLTNASSGGCLEWLIESWTNVCLNESCSDIKNSFKGESIDITKFLGACRTWYIHSLCRDANDISKNDSLEEAQLNHDTDTHAIINSRINHFKEKTKKMDGKEPFKQNLWNAIEGGAIATDCGFDQTIITTNINDIQKKYYDNADIPYSDTPEMEEFVKACERFW